MFTTIHALLLVAAAANIFCITENVFALNRMSLTIMALSVFVNVCFIFTLAANVNHEFFHVFCHAIFFILLVLSATSVAKEIHELYIYILKLAARCVTTVTDNNDNNDNEVMQTHNNTTVTDNNDNNDNNEYNEYYYNSDDDDNKNDGIDNNIDTIVTSSAASMEKTNGSSEIKELQLLPPPNNVTFVPDVTQSTLLMYPKVYPTTDGAKKKAIRDIMVQLKATGDELEANKWMFE
jgi:hypothetical protein